MFAYRDTSKECTRISNRIWGICSRKGCNLPIRGGATRPDSLREAIAELGVSGFARTQLENLVGDYERMRKRKDELSRMIAETVAANPKMLKLMQLPGVNYRGAFALEAAVEEESARRRGGTGKPMDGEGREDIKFFFTEAGQAVLTTCGGTPLGKWGWAMVNRGKPRHKAACAIVRKLLTYAWHIMRDDPTPNREGEALFRRKMRQFHKVIGARRMRELGFGTGPEFSARQADIIYGRLQPSPEGDD